MEPAQLRAQGALEYLLLIGGAVVVAVVVIFIMIGLAGSSGNATNDIITNSFAHIQGAIGDEGGTTVDFCGNGVVDVDKGEVCDKALPGATCLSLKYNGTGTVPCKNDCSGWEDPYDYGCG